MNHLPFFSWSLKKKFSKSVHFNKFFFPYIHFHYFSQKNYVFFFILISNTTVVLSLIQLNFSLLCLWMVSHDSLTNKSHTKWINHLQSFSFQSILTIQLQESFKNEWIICKFVNDPSLESRLCRRFLHAGYWDRYNTIPVSDSCLNHLPLSSCPYTTTRQQ